MARKLSNDAFEYYVGLGDKRNYQKVADHFGVSKRTVAKHAAEEKWRARIDDYEVKARERFDKRAVETIDAMKERHLKMLRVVQKRALETLAKQAIDNPYQAARTLTTALQHERIIRGDPGERTAQEIEEVIRREYELAFIPEGQEDDWSQFDAEQANDN